MPIELSYETDGGLPDELVVAATDETADNWADEYVDRQIEDSSGESVDDPGCDFDGEFKGEATTPAKASHMAGPLSLEQLKDLLSSQLCEPARLKRPDGVATGYLPLDEFLLWSGIPKGHLSLFCGALGTGATSLWIETANRVVKDGLWAGWINGEVPLAPQSLYHKQMDLSRLVSIEKPMSDAKLFWVLQEMMSSSLFEFIGCDLGSMRLREHQLRKLQTQAREANIALVFLSQLKPYTGSIASIFSLILNFEKKQISVERALHRPTPHSISRSITYARFTLHADHSRLTHEHKQNTPPNSALGQPSALPQTPGTTSSWF